MRQKRWNKPIASALAAAVVTAQVLGGAAVGSVLGGGTAKADPAPAPGAINLRLMSTTDVHTNVMGWDYFKGADSLTVGLDRTATLVKKARAEVNNTNNLLLDNGDLIQGTPLGTYASKQVDAEGRTTESNPMIEALNEMDYDVATLGNHEFNYGLPYLESVTSATYTEIPFINANVYNVLDNKNHFTPYVIKEMDLVDNENKTHKVKVGLIGLVTPQIMEWDKANLEGKVFTKDISETAAEFIPEMQSKGADIIIAMAHTGFDGSADGVKDENDINQLSKVKGIDAITFSHTHKIFPTENVSDLDASFKDASKALLPGINNDKGQINGVPAVQAGYGGANLGLIDLAIVPDGNGWKVDTEHSKSSTRSIYRTEVDAKGNKNNIANVEPDAAVDAVVSAAHEATIKYVNTPLGKTNVPMNSYFAMVQDDPTVQIVTYAQKRYVENRINTEPELAKYQGIPVLSVGAPFKAGRNGPTEYTDIKAGPLTISSASDLYLYDNTLKAIKVKGSTVKEWVEMSAGAFNRIKPAISTPQELLADFAVYNFDVIDGIKYTIDVTRAAKYDKNGKEINPDSSRVTSITYGVDDKPLNLDDEFIVVTNNYRASGGGNFPGVKGAEMVLDTLEENRQVLMDYIKEAGVVTHPADNNWSIAPIKGNVNVTFTSSPAAVPYAGGKISDTGETNAKGFRVFNLDLKQAVTAPTKDVEVHLLGINDFHGQLDTTSTVNNRPAGTAAYLATYLKQARAKYEHSLLFHNGDSVGASAPVSSMERDEPTMEWMNLMKFDVGTLGNHEFDQGVAAMKAQIFGGADPKNKSIVHKGADFDYINANAVDEKTGEPIINPYVIKEIGGVKIGFIGVVTKATPSKVSPEGTAGVKFLSVTEEVNAINKYAKELQDKKVETIIVLAHDPATTKDGKTTGEAADLANALPANSPVDVIVAGDNHALANGTVNGKLIVQAYSYGTAYDDIKLIIDPVTGDVKEKSAEVPTTFQDAPGITPDAESAALVQKYLDKHPELSKPVGTTDGTVTRTDVYLKEAPLGNLIADAMRQADFGDSKGAADFAFMNPGGIRADLPKGNVLFSDLAKIQPFGNTLVKLTLTGGQIKTLLQQQWAVKADGTADIKTLQISGLKYTANMYLPVASRVANMTLSDGTPIDMSKSYTAVVNNFMAAGGDNYKVLPLASQSLAGPIDLDVFYDYIVKKFKGGAITAAIEGRITNVDKDPGSSLGSTTPATPKPSATPTATPSPAASATPAPAATPAPVPTAAPAAVFKDLAKVAWAQEAINALAAKGIVKGIDGTNFAPVKSVTRAEFVTMLVRSLDLTNTAATTNFSDVKQGVWYTDTIAAAVNAGLVKGTGNGKFEPGREITREEMAIMIANALKDQLQTVDTSALNVFTDKAKIASYAQQPIAQLTKLGIVNGVDAQKFAPKGIANRAQAAVIIYRMLENKAS